MAYTRHSGTSTPGFVADRASIVRNTGRIIDWDYVPDSFRSSAETVQLAAAAAIGATSLTVDPLPVAILAGQFLNFGNYAPVTVTVNDADVNAAETTITVAALSGPIPAGTRLEFSGAGSGYAQLTADAAQGATTLTVEALPEDIDNAATALFAGGTQQVRVTANAAAGATSLTVDELQFAIADDDTATVAGTGDKVIPAGTIMAERTGGNGKIIPRSAVTGAETAEGFLTGTAYENAKEHALTGYGMIIGGVVYENLLPDRNHASFSTWIGEIRSAGTGVALQTYSDSRAS